MKVILSVFGRFHIFDLAEQLSKNDVLHQFFTSYPKFYVKRWALQEHKVSTIPILELLNRVRRRFLGKFIKTSFFLKVIFDFFIAVKMSRNGDLFIAWGGYNKLSISKAKKLGMLVLLESGSSHILFQEAIMKDCFSRYGLNYDVHTKYEIEQMLQIIEDADYIMIPSNFVKRTYIEYGVSEKKLVVNPYGVNFSLFTKKQKNDNIFRVIFCGSLGLRKGVQYLLQAFSELDLPQSELLLIGPVLDEIKPFLSKYNSEKIRAVGPQKQNKLCDFFSNGSIFVLPSIEEGLALVQAQAMACELPIICTTNTGGEDLISKNGREGFVIPIDDIGSLKEKIAFSYNNPKLTKNMGKRARIRALNNFTWEHYGDRYIKNLNLINEKKD